MADCGCDPRGFSAIDDPCVGGDRRESLVTSRDPRWAAGVCAGVHASGIRDVVYVPDNPLANVLRIFAKEFTGVRLVLATREEEAFGIAAGLYLGGRRPAVMLQSSGLGNSLNAITSLLIPYQIPLLMVVSMRGDAGEWNAAQVPMGRSMPAILDALGIPHSRLESADDAATTVQVAAETAFGTRMLHAVLVPRRVTAAREVSDTGPRGVSDTSDTPNGTR
jgi:sulfopyruvate decarboxylase alpha subunit